MKSEATYLTDHDVAERYDISVGTVRNWRCTTSGPPFIKLGPGRMAPVRYRLEDLLEWERRCRSTYDQVA